MPQIDFLNHQPRTNPCRCSNRSNRCDHKFKEYQHRQRRTEIGHISGQCGDSKQINLHIHKLQHKPFPKRCRPLPAFFVRTTDSNMDCQPENIRRSHILHHPKHIRQKRTHPIDKYRTDHLNHIIPGENSIPSVVNATPARQRLKMVIFASLSTSLIAPERLGCEMNNSFAASVIEPFSATVITYFNCCNVISVSPVMPLLYK